MSKDVKLMEQFEESIQLIVKKSTKEDGTICHKLLKQYCESFTEATNIVIELNINQETNVIHIMKMEYIGPPMALEEGPVKISHLDLTKQTISLGPESGPIVSLMKGHVDALTYVKAFREEGWNAEFPMSEDDLEHDAELESTEIKHTYGVFNPEKESWIWNCDKDEPNAEAVTIRLW